MNTNLKVAIEASILAGLEILKVYETDDFRVEMKSDNSPLTKADRFSHLKIIEFLNNTDYPVLSEEAAEIEYSNRKNWDIFWLVDPLDGTKEFIKRNGEFTVNIALIQNGSPIAGVIYVPVKKELFFADENGSFKQESVSNVEDFDFEKAVQLNGKQQTEDIRVVASRSHLSKETEEFINQIKEKPNVKSVETISAGSSLKLCMIAEGKADIYPRYAPTMEWDVAAGHAICKFANIPVVDAKTKQALQYNKENLLNPWFVVGEVK